jgi:hypothetical protein
LIREPQSLITGKALKHALPIGMAANQHHPTAVTGIALKRLNSNIALPKQIAKGSTDGVFPQPTNQANRGTKPRESTGHIGWSPTQSIITVSSRGR